MECVEERLTEVLGGIRAATVKKDEQLTSSPTARWNDEDFVEVTVNERTRDREADDRSTAYCVVPPPQIADADPATD